MKKPALLILTIIAVILAGIFLTRFSRSTTHTEPEKIVASPVPSSPVVKADVVKETPPSISASPMTSVVRGETNPVAAPVASSAPATVAAIPPAFATPPPAVATIPKPHSEQQATVQMYAAHASLRAAEVANPDSESNRRILSQMVAKAVAREARSFSAKP